MSNDKLLEHYKYHYLNNNYCHYCKNHSKTNKFGYYGAFQCKKCVDLMAEQIKRIVKYG